MFAKLLGNQLDDSEMMALMSQFEEDTAPIATTFSDIPYSSSPLPVVARSDKETSEPASASTSVSGSPVKLPEQESLVVPIPSPPCEFREAVYEKVPVEPIPIQLEPEPVNAEPKEPVQPTPAKSVEPEPIKEPVQTVVKVVEPEVKVQEPTEEQKKPESSIWKRSKPNKEDEADSEGIVLIIIIFRK